MARVLKCARVSAIEAGESARAHLLRSPSQVALSRERRSCAGASARVTNESRESLLCTHRGQRARAFELLLYYREKREMCACVCLSEPAAAAAASCPPPADAADADAPQHASRRNCRNCKPSPSNNSSSL